ncbi:Spc98 family-domain-containing protein [Blakeslea trispora]|nr:Spc98 family-domain-containing protein [Blakeslea trispora]
MLQFNSQEANAFDKDDWQMNHDVLSRTQNLDWQEKGLALDPLPNIPFDILNCIDLPSPSDPDPSVSTDRSSVSIQEDHSHDIWLDRPPSPTVFNTLSWDTYHSRYPSAAQTRLAEKRACTPYLTEIPLELFEPLVERMDYRATVVLESKLAKGLVQAMVGIPSVYFSWDGRQLVPSIHHVRIIGVTHTTIEPIISSLLLFGTRMKRLEQIAQQLQLQPEQYGLTGVAFGCCLTELILSIQHTIVQALSEHATILSIHQSVQPIADIVSRMYELCQIDNQGSSFHLPFGAALLNRLYQEAYQFDLVLDGSLALYRHICLAILSYSSVPYLDMLSSWLHLGRSWCDDQDLWNEFFVSVRQEETDMMERYQIKSDAVLPYFIDTDFATYLVRSGISLQLLKTSRPDHPLFQLNSTSLSLRCMMKDLEYETYMEQLSQVKQTIEQFNAGHTVQIPQTLSIRDKLTEETSNDTPTLPLLPVDQPSVFCFIKEFSDTLQDLIQQRTIPILDTITHQSYIEPLKTWCPLLNTSFMACFLQQFQLESHLYLLFRRFLLADGSFMHGLNALFFSQPDRIDIEYNIQWPPPRLAMTLHDVLLATQQQPEDSLVQFRIEPTTSSSNWINPRSVDALDFLNLTYQANYPLSMVITPTILSKYNRVFRFLLKLTRVQTVAKRMYTSLRNTHWFHIDTRDRIFRYRFQLEQFMNGLQSYVYDAVIQNTWHPFMQHVRAMKSNHSDDYVSAMMEPQAFREYHEHVLDCILFQCFLKQSQARIMQVLVPILQDILLFGVVLDDYASNAATPVTINQEEKLEIRCRKLFDQFQRNTAMFLHVLKTLEEKGTGRLSNILKSTRKSIFNELYIKHEAKHGMDVFVKDLMVRLSLNEFQNEKNKG